MTSLSYCIESTVLSETSRRGRPLHASLHARRGHLATRVGALPIKTASRDSSPMGRKLRIPQNFTLRNRGGEHGTYSYSEYCTLH